MHKTEAEENNKWRWGYDDYGDDDRDDEEEEEEEDKLSTLKILIGFSDCVKLFTKLATAR